MTIGTSTNVITLHSTNANVVVCCGMKSWNGEFRNGKMHGLISYYEDSTPHFEPTPFEDSTPYVEGNLFSGFEFELPALEDGLEWRPSIEHGQGWYIVQRMDYSRCYMCVGPTYDFPWLCLDCGGVVCSDCFDAWEGLCRWCLGN